jgi:N-carbamoylputrescine amidase
VLESTGVGDGVAVAEIDIPQALETARRSMFYLGDRRPDAYGDVETPTRTAAKLPAHA